MALRLKGPTYTREPSNIAPPIPSLLGIVRNLDFVIPHQTSSNDNLPLGTCVKLWPNVFLILVSLVQLQKLETVGHGINWESDRGHLSLDSLRFGRQWLRTFVDVPLDFGSLVFTADV